MASERRPYQVLLTRRSVGILKRLPDRDRRRIAAVIDSLARKPRPYGCEKLSGRGGLLRVREGSYRVVYAIDDGKRTVLVATIGHRRDVYRGLT